MTENRQMKPETLTALRGSIAKWQAIVDGTGVDTGADNCPLCEMFLNADELRDCIGCPVSERVNNDNCAGTPYVAWDIEHKRGWESDNTRRVNTEGQRNAAQRELDFLISLLPKGEIP